MVGNRPNWNIVIAENTIISKTRFHGTALGKSAGPIETVLLKKNSGESNKGVGELDMLTQVSHQVRLEDYDSISYFSGRRLVTCPFVFDRTEKSTGRILLGNPDFLGLDGSFYESEKKRMFADMFFSMPPEQIRRYIDFFHSRRDRAIKDKTSSEELLYEFVTLHKIDFDWLEHYGFVRLQPASFFRKGKWHIV